jgi:hypothetical protein
VQATRSGWDVHPNGVRWGLVQSGRHDRRGFLPPRNGPRKGPRTTSAQNAPDRTSGRVESTPAGDHPNMDVPNSLSARRPPACYVVQVAVYGTDGTRRNRRM